MKTLFWILCISSVVVGCKDEKDEGPSTRDLLTGNLWVLDDINNDPDNYYDGINYMEVELLSNGTYRSYIEFVGGSYEYEGEWELNSNILYLDSDEFEIESITSEEATLVDEDEVALIFIAGQK
jgi:hypothetical protein